MTNTRILTPLVDVYVDIDSGLCKNTYQYRMDRFVDMVVNLHAPQDQFHFMVATTILRELHHTVGF